MAELEAPLKVGGDAIDVTLNLGLAPIERGAGPGAAIEQANIALDQARGGQAQGRLLRRRGLWRPGHQPVADERHAGRAGRRRHRALLPAEVRHAPAQGDRRRGAVALAPPRPRHAAPDLFIPMAEETGHIRTLTEWVFKRAIDDQAQLAEPAMCST